MITTSFKQMHREIGTKGIILVVIVYAIIATIGSTIGYLLANEIIKWLSGATGLSA